MGIIVRDSVSAQELGKTVYRYLTVEKFRSLMERGAGWFCQLDKLEDEFEGTLPSLVRNKAEAHHLEMKSKFPAHLADQFDTMTARNIQDGRKGVAVACWHLSQEESPRMWKEYAGGNGVAIRSTILGLSEAFAPFSATDQFPQLGAVQYVDFESYDEMPLHKTTDAFHRAFLKDKRFEHEREIRVATLNLQQTAGGLYVPCALRNLMPAVIVAPGSSLAFIAMIAGWLARRRVLVPVFPSQLERR